MKLVFVEQVETASRMTLIGSNKAVRGDHNNIVGPNGAAFGNNNKVIIVKIWGAFNYKKVTTKTDQEYSYVDTTTR
jgi:hypothetical protein